MGTAAPPQRLRPLSTQHPTMTRDLATSLLNRAADGAQLLEILESIATDTEQGTATDFDGTPIVW
jgi:hypothetical protein